MGRSKLNWAELKVSVPKLQTAALTADCSGTQINGVADSDNKEDSFC